MERLLAENHDLIRVMTRFGIRMGFGEATVKEVCERRGVDCNTFLAVVNFVMDGFSTYDRRHPVSVASLLHYLKQSHIYFLEYCLPRIRRKLLDGIKLRTTDVSFLMLKFFDEYFNELRMHMEYEEQQVFRYVDALLEGRVPKGFHISTYSEHHEQVASKLGELKNLIIKYCPEDADANLLNDALDSIYRCERDLENHCLVEDHLLVPEILRLEKSGNGVEA